jgi:hypothetical protein
MPKALRSLLSRASRQQVPIRRDVIPPKLSGSYHTSFLFHLFRTRLPDQIAFGINRFQISAASGGAPLFHGSIAFFRPNQL